MTKKKGNHYVDNVELQAAMIKFKEAVLVGESLDGKRNGPSRPRVTEYIGKCIMDISVHRSRERNFIGYSFRQEMVSDGIENCLLYIDNYNAVKYSNPFAYFSQIVYYAFLRRILKENKNLYTKFKIMDDAHFKAFTDSPYPSGDASHSVQHTHTDWSQEYINNFVERFENTKRKNMKKRKDKKAVRLRNTE